MFYRLVLLCIFLSKPILSTSYQSSQEFGVIESFFHLKNDCYDQAIQVGKNPYKRFSSCGTQIDSIRIITCAHGVYISLKDYDEDYKIYPEIFYYPDPINIPHLKLECHIPQIHERYEYYTIHSVYSKWDYDIAMVQLKSPFPLKVYPQLCMAHSYDFGYIPNVFICGYHSSDILEEIQTTQPKNKKICFNISKSWNKLRNPEAYGQLKKRKNPYFIQQEMGVAFHPPDYPGDPKNMIIYTIRTKEGMSGSGIYEQREDQKLLFAVHTGEDVEKEKGIGLPYASENLDYFFTPLGRSIPLRTYDILGQINQNNPPTSIILVLQNENSEELKEIYDQFVGVFNQSYNRQNLNGFISWVVTSTSCCNMAGDVLSAVNGLKEEKIPCRVYGDDHAVLYEGDNEDAVCQLASHNSTERIDLTDETIDFMQETKQNSIILTLGSSETVTTEQLKQWHIHFQKKKILNLRPHLDDLSMIDRYVMLLGDLLSLTLKPVLISEPFPLAASAVFEEGLGDSILSEIDEYTPLRHPEKIPLSDLRAEGDASKEEREGYSLMVNQTPLHPPYTSAAAAAFDDT